MNRGYYCKVESNVELRDMAEDLREIGEKVDLCISVYDVIPEDNLWCWLGYNQDFRKWALFREEPEGIRVDSEDLIDKVVNKESTKLVEWYEYIASSYDRFTKGNVYKCINPANLEASCNFIDNEGNFNGYGGSNRRYFKPRPDYVPEDEFVLPKKWCIKVQENSCPGIVREWRLRPLKNYGNWVDGGYICGDTGYHTGSTKNFPIGYTEITLEQFKKYVLKEEKEEVPEKVRKFKLGDTIYLVKDRDKNAPKGSSAKVVDYDDKYVHVEWIDTKGEKQNNGQYYEKDFSLENPMKEEFKIGEWIATTNKSYGSYGKIVQVKNIDGDRFYVSPDGWWERKDVRKVTPEEIACCYILEIGDYVVITSNTNSSNNKVGDIGIITEIIPTVGFRVQVDGRPEYGNCTRLTDLRRALPSEIPHQDEYICKADPIHTSDEPKSLLDREEIEVTIKKTAPKQFNIF
jgi:uncharacterized protein YlzI (FlbEa/FlbD family)